MLRTLYGGAGIVIKASDKKPVPETDLELLSSSLSDWLDRMRLTDGEICGTVAADVIGRESSAPNPGFHYVSDLLVAAVPAGFRC